MSLASNNNLTASEFSALLKDNNFDFVDFGCGIGGSMQQAKHELFGLRGLGLDICEKKVTDAKAAGYDAACVNILTLPIMPKSCRFVMISHFLEHLNSTKDAAIMIRNAIALAEDFVYIQQPYFDADGLLFQEGYKLYWSDWHGHPNQMTSLEFHNILNRFLKEELITRFIICAKNQIKRASHPAILPIDTPMDQQSYDGSIHLPKQAQILPFRYPVYDEIRVLIETGNSKIIDDCIPISRSKKVLFDSKYT